MKRVLRRIVGALCLPIAAVAFGGCGNDGVIGVGFPGGGGEPGPVVTGGVLAPGRTLAGEPRWWRFAWLAPPSALALGPTVQPVGPNVGVQLRSATAADAADGSVNASRFVAGTTTGEDGRFSIPLKNEAVGDCGLFLEVGSAQRGTLMRAFVYSDDVDVSAVSEAVVRLMLDYVARNRVDLCVFYPPEIERLGQLVDGIARSISGVSVADLNDRVEAAAAGDSRVYSLLRDATI